MRTTTTLASAIGIALLSLVTSDQTTLPSTTTPFAFQPPPSYDGRPACVDKPVIARGTDIVDPEHLSEADVAAADEQLIRAEREQRAVSRQGPTRSQVVARPGRRVVVRVFAHVLRDGRRGGVPRHRIVRQLHLMSRAYAGRQSGASASSPFRFWLVGADVTVNANWYRMDEGSVAERHAKRALHRGDASDLNLYFASSRSGLLGWATQPTAYGGAPLLDGVVVNDRTLPGGSSGRYSAGDVAVHETGHWLGLFHTFTGRCGGRGDRVADTPAESRPSYTCPRHRNTCTAPGLDPIRNFMDYSYDGCMNRFTIGQVVRMRRAWSALRRAG